MLVETLTIGNRVARYMHAGEARAVNTVVLIHAFPLGSRMWNLQFDGLDAVASTQAGVGWRLLAPSLPGFDGTSRLAEPSIEGYARHVLEVLDAVGVASAVVVGLSMGGYVAFELLRQARER